MKAGQTAFDVYRTEFAGTNQATALTFNVDDIAIEVDELKAKGVSFELYELEGLTRIWRHLFRGRNEDSLVQGPGRILSLIEFRRRLKIAAVPG